MSFLTQIRQKDKGKEIVLIVDNASIHKSKETTAYLERYKNIHIFYLPPYSPQYNPVELFWKWIKPKVYGFSPLGGLKVLIRRFRKLLWHYNWKTMVNPINFKLESFTEIL